MINYKYKYFIILLITISQSNAQTPELVKDIVPNGDSSLPQFLTIFNDELYFATALTHGLWKTDGTEIGTVIAEGTGSIGNDFATGLGVFNNQLYFNTFSNRAWWSTAGGIDNAIMIKNQFNLLGGVPYTSSMLGEEVLVFSGVDYSISGNPANLYRSDLTSLGTVEFGTFVTDSSGPTPRMIGTVNSELLFSATETNQGRELYSTDATTASTDLLVEFNSGPVGGISDVSGTNQSLLNNEYYFPAFGDNGVKLWKTDATEMGTHELDDLTAPYSSPQYLNVYNDSIYFFADGAAPPDQLFKISSFDTGPTQLTSREFFSEAGCISYSSMVLDGILYFPFADDSMGCELWRTDGTTIGTYMLKDINTDSLHSYPNFMKTHDGWLYFTALKQGFGFEMWKTDGTESGTSMVADINTGNGSSINNTQMIEYNEELYFIANDGIHGTELFKLKFEEEIIFTDGFESDGPI